MSCSYSHSQIESHHAKIFEDVLFEYYNDSEAVEKTMLMINKFFVQFKEYNDDGFITMLVAASLINLLVTDNKVDLNSKSFHGLSIRVR